MGKTRKHFINRGGKVIASGGYGCVFNPSLKCQGSTNRDKHTISKLMTTRHAREEYEEINNIKEKVDSVPNYKEYFLLYDATICKPAKLDENDLADFNNKCTALPKDGITKKNINDKLDQVMTLNMPNGGKPVDDYIYANSSFKQIYNVHLKLVTLLKRGIIPLNKHNIYHCDIKDSNVLVDDSTNDLKTRLIDWGLSIDYKPNEDEPFPKNWRNRPLQFNVPFSVIIFSDSFVEKYTAYLKDGGKVNEETLKPFVIDYVNSWMKERGAGHYKFINEIMYKLYGNDLTNMTEKTKPVFVETQITMPTIVNYIIDVLIHYTKFKENGDLNVRVYLNEVFTKIVDIYGFINVYYPLLELLSNNYSVLDVNELKLLNNIKNLFYTYLYKPRHEPYDMNTLLYSLKQLGKSIRVVANGENININSVKTRKISKTNKTNSNKHQSNKSIFGKRKTTSELFKRKKLIKRFKNPIFLSLN
jgi:serine/threonine protein kinase